MSELRNDYRGYTVQCSVCRKTKAPVGRSVPIPAAAGYCSAGDCEGYYQEPGPSHLWPNESEADFGYKVPR